MEILLKGTRTEIPLRLIPYVANWATVSYLQYDFGHLLLQRFLHKYYRICIYRFIADRSGSLRLQCEQGTILLQLITEGPIKNIIQGYGHVLLQSGQYAFCYFPAGTHEIQLDAGEYESMYITLHTSLLEELAESLEDMRAILSCLHTASSQGACLTPLEMDYRMQDIISDIRRCRETGGNLLVEFSTSIRNLLNLYRKALQAADQLRKLQASVYTAAVISIQEEVAKNPSIQQHTLAYFARKHNMSQSTLKRYFKAVCKKTLHRYVWEECMKKAVWMRYSQQLSLDEIADEVGYADKSGFLKSFKKYAGGNGD
ncbi:helix-turn-helix domain-containing protein [Chitinophaga japonensis]|uniref:Helix-turn-helix protein n=1 Tax=Chitinophaga japonensis TaxID=104662 RepID=A0A562TDH8_CHIJA|nr:AraC family transcriptional regulator [Chitinophaga japonensis]TWI91126.1 helix-turn-helix protein [Chitinophaga japonensis]